MRYTCSDSPGVFKVTTSDNDEVLGYFQVLPGKGAECKPILQAIGRVGEPAQWGIEHGTNSSYLQNAAGFDVLNLRPAVHDPDEYDLTDAEIDSAFEAIEAGLQGGISTTPDADLLSAADDVLVNILDAGQDVDEETGERYADVAALESAIDKARGSQA